MPPPDEQTKRDIRAARAGVTPVPRNEDGTINWRKAVAVWSTVVGLLGGGGTVAAMNWPFEPSEQVVKLEKQLEEKDAEIERQKEARLGGIERRLSAIETTQQEQSKTLEYIKAKARRWGQ